jgi:phosphoheptose isomerase
MIWDTNTCSPSRFCYTLKMRIITLSGFDADNPLRKLGDVNFHVPSDRYGIVEVAHHAICHSILDAVMNDA